MNVRRPKLVAAQPDSPQNERVPGQTVVDFIVDALTRSIASGALVAGQRLVEADLTARLGVSRGPLREALSRLDADGVITIEPYRGAIVKNWTKTEVRSVFHVREVLDGLAARLAAEQIDAGKHRRILTDTISRMRTGRHHESIDVFARENASFHAQIILISGNHRLVKQIAQLQFPSFRKLHYHLLDEAARLRSVLEHIRIAEAIVEGDSVAAEHYARKHVRRTLALVENNAEADPEV